MSELKPSKNLLRAKAHSLDEARVRLQTEIGNVIESQKPSDYRLRKLIREITEITDTMNKLSGHEDVEELYGVTSPRTVGAELSSDFVPIP